MIKLGSNNIGKIYYGTSSIGKVYLGSNLVYGGSSPTPSYTPDSYVQSGLISMFDGEWNNGRNSHLSSGLTTWKDLIGSNDLTVTTGVTIGDNYLQNTDYSKSVASKSGAIQTARTIEFVFKLDDADTSASAFVIANRMDTLNNNTRARGNFHFNHGSFGNLYFESWGAATDRRGVPFAISDRNIHTISAGWETNSAATAGAVLGYIDGANELVSNLNGTGREGAGDNLVIGGLYPYVSVYGTKGKFYCIRFYNRLLTTQEVLANQAVDAARFGITLTTNS